MGRGEGGGGGGARGEVLSGRTSAGLSLASLYPSATDTLIALGAADRVVARTSYCPPVAGAAVIGGTKNPDLTQLRALRPGLVIACRDENRREDVEAIEAFARVHLTDPKTVADVPALIRDLASAAACDPAAAEPLATAIATLAARPAPAPRRRAAVFIWRNPWWTAGGDAYLTDLLRTLGLDNVLAAAPRTYFPCDLAVLAAARPEVLLFPDEPFAFTPADADALAAESPALADVPRRFFDGSLLTWHGARTARALRELPLLLA